MSVLAKDVCRNLILVSTIGIVFAVLAGLYAWRTTPLYRSSTLLLAAEASEHGVPRQLGGGLGGLASFAGIDLGSGRSNKIEALATLNSRSFLTAFILERKLKKVLFQNQWDAQGERWTDEEPTPNDAYKIFTRKILKINDDPTTGLVIIQVDWTSPVVAADWANSLVSQLNAEMRTRARAEAERSILFLENEYSRTSVFGVKSSISTLLEKQVNKIMLANVREEFAFRVLDPAVPADIDDPIYPKTLLLVVAGFIFGMFLAIAILFIRDSKFPGIVGFGTRTTTL